MVAAGTTADGRSVTQIQRASSPTVSHCPPRRRRFVLCSSAHTTRIAAPAVGKDVRSGKSHSRVVRAASSRTTGGCSARSRSAS